MLKNMQRLLVMFLKYRRSINSDQRFYLIGKRYAEEKKAVGENRYTIPKNESKGGNSYPPTKTAQKIAEQTNVSEKTVKNAEKYAKAVGNVSENAKEV